MSSVSRKQNPQGGSETRVGSPRSSLTSRVGEWLGTETASPQVILVTGAPGMGKSRELELATHLAQQAGAEVLMFDGRIEPIDAPRLLAVLAKRGWVEQDEVPVRDVRWTSATSKRLLVVDHVEHDPKTMVWLSHPQTREALKPDLAVLMASRRRAGEEDIEHIHLGALAPDDSDDHSAGFPTLLNPQNPAELAVTRGLLADQLLSDSSGVLEALSLVERATLDGIMAIMGQTISREALVCLKDCSWVHLMGPWLGVESAAAAVIRRDFVVTAPERYAQWLKRAAEWSSKVWLQLTSSQRAWMVAALGTASAITDSDSVSVRLPDAAIWRVVRQDEKRSKSDWAWEFPMDADVSVWVMQDGEGRPAAAAAWTRLAPGAKRADATDRVQAQFSAGPAHPDASLEQMASVMAAALVVDLLSSLGVGWVSRGSGVFDAVLSLVSGTPILADTQEDGLVVDGHIDTPQAWLTALAVSRHESHASFPRRMIPESVVRSALRGFHRLSYLNDLARDHQLEISGRVFQDLLLGILVAADPPVPLTKEHQRLLRLTYIERPGTADAIASRLAMSRTTYYRQLAEAQVRMAEAVMSVVGNSPLSGDV